MNYPVRCEECGVINKWEFDDNGVVVCRFCHKPLKDRDQKKTEAPAVITHKGGVRKCRC